MIRKIKAVTVTSLCFAVTGAGLAGLTGTAGAEPLSASAVSASPVKWGACPKPPAGIKLDPRQACGTVKVPLDYRHPDGKQITIAVSRIPAADPARRRGVLLLNPGGPGAEGLDMPTSFEGQASKAVLASYDLIGFDPRGVGHSAPVTCGLTAAQDRKAYPLTAGSPANVWPCAFWPAPVAKPVKVTSHGPRDILILQNRRDPAATLASGQGMHTALGHRSAMVTVNAGGHGVYGTQGPKACSTTVTDAFLAGGKLPARDLNCPAPR